MLKPNDRWSMDFVSDTTRSGARFRIFALLDEVTRAYLDIEIETSIGGQQIARYLNKAIMFYGKPSEILSDNLRFVSVYMTAFISGKSI